MSNQMSLFAEPVKPDRPAENFRSTQIKAAVPNREHPVTIGQIILGPMTTNLKANVIWNQPIFYRVQSQWDFFYHRKTKTVGCDMVAWHEAIEQGALYMVTYAEAERRLCIVHRQNVNRTADWGHGKQMRAHIDKCIVLEDVDRWVMPKPDQVIVVESE